MHRVFRMTTDTTISVKVIYLLLYNLLQKVDTMKKN